MGYNGLMVEVRQTAEFSRWLRRLKDANAAARMSPASGASSLEIRVIIRASAPV
jgi:hypothetical protein